VHNKAAGTGAALPAGVIFCGLDEAVRAYPELVRPYLAPEEAPGEKFSALTAALWAGGTFVYVPENVHLEWPLQASYGEAGGTAFAPRSLVIVERGGSLVYVDCFGADGSPEEGELLSVASTHVIVGEGAQVQYVGLQERGPRTWHFATQRFSVGRDARVDVVVGGLGSQLSKSFVQTSLLAPGAEANLVGVVLTDGDQHIDHQTTQEHLAPHTTSNLLLKSAVKGRSRSIFLGLVRMPEEAQQSDAFQEARALLLSEQAKADAVPKLEIVANDVRCTHAGAIGEIDAEQKFYLSSRGIPEAEAEQLIVAGFFEPALVRIPVEQVRERVRSTLARRLETLHG
ncbi:MAG: Fe-S cluster assembly protein SufD, partial [Chloroflexota bacterium]